jgi:hypothetical protein
MADLRIDDVTAAAAVAGLRAAASRLTPVTRAVRVLDAEVAGANALADELDRADQSLAAVLGSPPFDRRELVLSGARHRSVCSGAYRGRPAAD